MKKIFISGMLLAGISSWAQEAGKAGELLKNEASATEMRTSKSPDERNKTFNQPRSGNTPIPQRSGNENRIKNPNYQWNRNYGYAEVFLRIPEQGFFTVEVGDQMMANGSGKYRFFDLSSGRIPISIYDNGFLIYRTTLMVRNNNRMVLDFFTNEGLYLLDSYPVQNQYGFNDWNDVWNNPYGNQPGGGYYNGNAMDDNSFRHFFDTMMQNERFDDGKLTMIHQQMRVSMFTSAQIRDLVKAIRFDDKKLALAKSIYRNCVDREHYIVVTDAFDFESSRRELMEYVSKL
ncbi:MULTISPECIES: DUF4476 domain-containing protein [Chryseobacterium]|uniref:DUF4476 domain-containing protein n=1 Tax=Chryseobacterium candidae TaxID=1978493 RepID=A0ABY2RCV3_9FLAO|nr:MULTISPECIES: DUF4476 domain-containing protein [Chryseobacterium]PXW18227.1 uncharacterized protein DUF4476 [Chryseobacterium sp. CBTAP 102]THV63413.1 DUF4476 domain-containing protein [Chryseobacterium candidae]